MARGKSAKVNIGKKPKKASELYPDDLHLWDGVTQSMNPLTHGKNLFTGVILPAGPASNPKLKKKFLSDTLRRMQPQPLDTKTKPKSNVKHELFHGDAPGVDKRTSQRLMKGKTAIEARLDLHGFTKQAAHVELNAFVGRCYARGMRCVLVITGKGLRVGTGEIGVLRKSVPDWLNSPTLRPMVLQFSHATPRDGGEGALYVLLKRQR